MGGAWKSCSHRVLRDGKGRWLLASFWYESVLPGKRCCRRLGCEINTEGEPKTSPVSPGSAPLSSRPVWLRALGELGQAQAQARPRSGTLACRALLCSKMTCVLLRSWGVPRALGGVLEIA